MSSVLPPWSIFQLGAREHYAIPRALAAGGVESELITDFWFQGPVRGLLPKSLKDRFHPGVMGRVRNFNARMLAFEVKSRLGKRRGWPLMEARNRAFGRLAANVPTARTVFAYSYAAGEIFERSKARSRLVLGQIDPGPFEQSLVEELHERHGLRNPPRPSNEYWDRWRREVELADVIVVNSSWSRDALAGAGVPIGKVAVVPLAFEREAGPGRERRFPAEFSTERPLELLFLGQVIVRKGVYELLDAARRLKNAPVRWTIVGGGDEGVMSRLAEAPTVNVVGPVARSEAARYYAQADAFVLPTHSDGFALTQLEAAACGLPLIVSRFCGDVVRDTETGFVLREVTADAIVEAIERILASPEQLAAMSQAVQELSEFSLPRIGQRLLEAAGEVQGEKREIHAGSV